MKAFLKCLILLFAYSPLALAHGEMKCTGFGYEHIRCEVGLSAAEVVVHLKSPRGDFRIPAVRITQLVYFSPSEKNEMVVASPFEWEGQTHQVYSNLSRLQQKTVLGLAFTDSSRERRSLLVELGEQEAQSLKFQLQTATGLSWEKNQ